jgi:hypothetical protein
VVYAQMDGKRFAVLDYRAVDAPKGERVMSGGWLKEYGLEYIDVVRPASVKPLKNVKASNPPVPKMGSGKVGASGLPPIDNPWAWPIQLYARTPAYFSGWRSNYDLRNQYIRSGAFVGCENATTRIRNCTHSSTVSWSWTVGGNTKLTAEKVIEIGFEYNQTHSDSDSFTFTDIPPMTGLWDIPYTVAHKRFFNSNEDEYVCGAPQGARVCWSNTIFNGTYSYLDYWWQFAGLVDRMVERPLGSPPDA